MNLKNNWLSYLVLMSAFIVKGSCPGDAGASGLGKEFSQAVVVVGLDLTDLVLLDDDKLRTYVKPSGSTVCAGSVFSLDEITAAKEFLIEQRRTNSQWKKFAGLFKNPRAMSIAYEIEERRAADVRRNDLVLRSRAIRSAARKR